MDKKYLKLLNDFANTHVLTTNMKVTISDHHTSFEPRYEHGYAKYEDANLLADIIRGA